jgi:hypothetical protein
MALTHRCSSHPSTSQERSSGPSLLSTGKPLVHWAATCGLLGNSGAAPSSGHRVWCCRSWSPSGGCHHRPGGFTFLSGGQYGWFRCSGKLGCNGGRCARPCAATGAVRRAPSISTHLGRANQPICGMVHMCGDTDMRHGDYGSRAGSRGGRGDGLQPAAGLCSAVQRDRVCTRRRRLHG